MPQRRSKADSPFLFVSFDKRGTIEAASMLHALPEQASKAIESRALVIGATKHQAFRVNSKKDGGLEFERVR